MITAILFLLPIFDSCGDYGYTTDDCQDIVADRCSEELEDPNDCTCPISEVNQSACDTEVQS